MDRRELLTSLAGAGVLGVGAATITGLVGADPALASGNNQYVHVHDGALNDDGDGSDALPYKTIKKGLDVLRAAGGGVLFIHPGAYLITSPLLVDFSNIWIRGSGKATRIIWNGSSSNHMIKVQGASTSYISGITISDLAVVGTNLVLWSIHNIRGEYVRDLRILNCEISNAGQHGVSLSSASRIMIAGCYLHDCGLPTPPPNGGSGALAGLGTSEVVMANNLASKNTLDGLQDKTANNVTYTATSVTRTIGLAFRARSRRSPPLTAPA